jgi:hypothetical protein
MNPKQLGKDLAQMKRRTILLAALAALVTASAFAAGIENKGTYRTNNLDRGPADITENVRIIPPPTGGDLQVRIRADRARYHIGDRLKLTFGANRDSYVYIFVTDAGGITRQVFPNYYDTNNFVRSGRTYFIPDRSYDLEITAPTGNENVTIVAVEQDFPFLGDFRRYTVKDPYPATREGAASLVRRIESFRTEPSALSMEPLRPAPRKQFWAEDSTTYRVMGTDYSQPLDYKVPRFGNLDIDTVPNNARIYIDGEYRGRTPQVVDRLTIGDHKMLLTKEGYLPYECNVTVTGNQTKQLDLFLKQTPVRPGYSRGDKPAGVDGIGFFQRQP